MKVLNLIFFASLVGSSWCGIILHNIRDGLHSKLYGHGLHGENYQNSPIININNQQQVVQQSAVGVPHVPSGPRGDYGSLPSTHENQYLYGTNFKAGSTKYSHHGYNPQSHSYGSHHMGGGDGGFRGESASGISSHQMMKQESYKHREGPKFGYHHDTNIFGNAQGFNSNNVPIYSSSSSSASSSSSSSLGGSSSSASSSSSSTSAVGSGGVFRPWRRRS
ncbi:uncharacterized protein DDB_G0271670-like [Lucilia cuprina]|uniref:uncharacterized protein DDB_G0271670-like n=1 Tax=Lucilia cuprina TaxID=7375 RepID=UPI001F051C5D|nr:uncharacterized protein DDB_G0271670-like [Lucilia cuprina]